ncbi:MAG TPA: acetolactate synthase small subunit, partial [Candidatus Angelobacter sp.]|nr:acetolactate synthase small subunit [Candidatus Angelobacter sp.]
IVGLFSGRGLNIESLTVAETRPGVSRLTLVCEAGDYAPHKLLNLLTRQVRVIHAQEIDEGAYRREMALVYVPDESAVDLSELTQLLSSNQARVVQVKEQGFLLELTGSQEEIERILKRLSQLGISDVVRSGAVALSVLKTNQQDELNTRCIR